MNFGKMMKQVQQAQSKMEKIQAELADDTVEASAGGGTVRVVMTGSLEVRSIVIDPAAVDPDDVEMLSDLVTAAVNEALRSAQSLAAQKMSAVTGGLNIPGLM